MFRERHLFLVAGAAMAVLWAAAWSGARAEEPAAPPSEKEWQEALARIRQIALDKNEAEEHRADAVTACARLLVSKKQYDEALEFCREVLKSPEKTAPIDPALRAGGLVERNRSGHLRAEIDFLAAHVQGPGRERAAAVSQQLEHTVQALASLAGKMMVPGPVALRCPPWATGGPGEVPPALRVAMPKVLPPAWYRFPPGEAPPALHVTLPKLEPPPWYSRLTFPPLKEPRKN